MPESVGFQIAAPGLLLWAPVAIVVMLLAALLLRRHSRWTRLWAWGIRAAAACVLVVAIAGFVQVREDSRNIEPQGVWRLLLDADAPRADARDFAEPVSTFINRVRNVVAGETPPERVEVWGEREHATRARDALLALGMPTTAHWPPSRRELSPRIHGIDAPAMLQPGEAATVTVDASLGNTRLTVFLDGHELAHEEGKVELRAAAPGRHVLEAVLTEASGTELQRAGHVVRVSDQPRVLLLGLSDEQASRAVLLAPGWQHERVPVENFRSEVLDDPESPVSVVLASVQSLFGLGMSQAYELSVWIARGGGLFATGDGAKFVAPEYMPMHIRRVLPVTLLKEGRPPAPEDPPVEEIEGKAEIAKVSIIFVLDRSTSMNQRASRRDSSPLRWDVAVRGVAESMAFVAGGEGRASESLNTRVGVLAFTLDRNWIARPQAMLPFDRSHVRRRLEALGSDGKYDDFGFNTDIYAAMEDALGVMKEEPSSVKVIVLLSDGADRPAVAAAGKRHSTLREQAIAADINIVTVGIGDEFDGSSPNSGAARSVVNELATKPEFANIPGSSAEAERAHVIFVNTVELAFRSYDERKQQEEEERRRRLEEQPDDEPENVDILPGEFALRLMPAGVNLFGESALPDPAPRAAWYARSQAKPGSAVALALEAEDSPPALAFNAYGLGRTAFWSVGSDAESAGEVAAWADFPGVFAASLRWLTPREVPDIRLVGDATPHGVALLDPLPEATYLLRSAGLERELALADGELGVEGGLPLGAAEIIERVGEEERAIGDIYIAAPSASGGMVEVLPDNPPPAAFRASVAEPRLARVAWPEAAVYLGLLFLMLMPIERAVRRRI